MLLHLGPFFVQARFVLMDCLSSCFSYASVQISFPDVGSKSEIVKLRGPKQDVDKCAVEIQKRYKDLLESNYQVKVHIFKQFHKFIIGKAGATINQIRQNTK